MGRKLGSWFLLAALAAGVPIAHADHEAGGPGRTTAPSNEKSRITGCVTRDNEGEFLSFDLQFGADSDHYKLKGESTSDQGVYRTDGDFSGIRVTRERNDGGMVKRAALANEGNLKFYPRKRSLENAKLADIPVSGSSLRKRFTGSLVMNDLSVDGQPSSGKMFFNVFTGTYKCDPGTCHFGKYALGSTDKGGKILLNYDNFINRRVRVSMKFGDLDLTGLLKFSDTTRTITVGSGEDQHTYTTVASRKTCFNVDMKKSDGSSLNLAEPGKSPTADDLTVRHLIAWLEIMGSDLFGN